LENGQPKGGQVTDGLFFSVYGNVNKQKKKPRPDYQPDCVFISRYILAYNTPFLSSIPMGNRTANSF